jgi:hypothetical protein
VEKPVGAAPSRARSPKARDTSVRGRGEGASPRAAFSRAPAPTGRLMVRGGEDSRRGGAGSPPSEASRRGWVNRSQARGAAGAAGWAAVDGCAARSVSVGGAGVAATAGAAVWVGAGAEAC